MRKKKEIGVINNPEQLSKSIESTNLFTWIALSFVVLCLVSFFVWSFLARITYKVTGHAEIKSGQVTLTIDDKDLSQIKAGQKIYISSMEGEVIDVEDDGYPIVSNFELADGDYDYYIVIKVIRPIDYYFNNR